MQPVRRLFDIQVLEPARLSAASSAQCALAPFVVDAQMPLAPRVALVVDKPAFPEQLARMFEPGPMQLHCHDSVYPNGAPYVFWILAAALIAAFLLSGCTATAPGRSIHPASLSPAKHCEEQGGKRRLERGPGGEIGVCVFADNRQCEERALLVGECPPGGIPVGGYATTSERHCAIRGGRMTIPGCVLSPAGLYETRNALLLLQAGRTAMLRRGPSASASSLIGTWDSSGNVVTVSTEQERLVFDYAGDRLIPREWDRRSWGAEGPGTLVRQK